MKFTRKHDVLRILVGCVDYTLIPFDSTVFIKDGFYRLKYIVENQVDVGDTEEDAPHSPPPDEDGDDSEGSNNQEKDKKLMDNNSSDAMAMDEVAMNSEIKGTMEAAASEPMLEQVSGVVFSPQVQKQFLLAQ